MTYRDNARMAGLCLGLVVLAYLITALASSQTWQDIKTHIQQSRAQEIQPNE
ncbi:hypothetical protein H6G00_00330 [Leptolyngbya sp. FACHB-541]|uniref:hypothetical protein n=1 Tax=Leptolyngbya sp. FACHB-541 TaxID=2692810 RepID=UPI0016841568|nr:hypothetical protein [Leptolyngbya sp. FACHB-541]MBD1995075.1 hypothetical protein [Leptolyngbya sp. FACHB-541]